MNVVELNRPAVWQPIRSEETSVRKYSGAYPYLTRGGVIARSTPGRPVLRYAKNFRKFKLDFSLFMFTDETDTAQVDSFLDAQIKDLKKADVVSVLAEVSMSNFKYLDSYYGGEQ